MASKHTKSPLLAIPVIHSDTPEPLFYNVAVPTEYPEHTHTIGSAMLNKWTKPEGLGHEEALANAKLWASSPELYDLLKAVPNSVKKKMGYRWAGKLKAVLKELDNV